MLNCMYQLTKNLTLGYQLAYIVSTYFLNITNFCFSPKMESLFGTTVESTTIRIQVSSHSIHHSHQRSGFVEWWDGQVDD